jgi:hypothetical protein
LFAILGVFYLSYFLISQTVFSSDAIKQRNGIGQTVKYLYSDIQRLELRRGGIILSTSDRRKLNVYGARNQLIVAQQVLQERAPQAFDDGINEELPGIADERNYIRIWRKRALYSGTALLLSSASVYPFLAGHSLHGDWESIGKYLILLSMGLLLVFVYCAALWYIAWQSLHDVEGEQA